MARPSWGSLFWECCEVSFMTKFSRSRLARVLLLAICAASLTTALAQEADLDWVAVDSTSIRAQAQAAGGRLKRGALRPRALAGPAAGSAPRSTR